VAVTAVPSAYALCAAAIYFYLRLRELQIEGESNAIAACKVNC